MSPRARSRFHAVVVRLFNMGKDVSELGNAGKTSVEPAKVSLLVSAMVAESMELCRGWSSLRCLHVPARGLLQ